MILCGVAPLFVYTEFNMFKWLTDLFKDNRCECRGCMVTRCGCGYAPCAGVTPPETNAPDNTVINKPPRKP